MGNAGTMFNTETQKSHSLFLMCGFFVFLIAGLSKIEISCGNKNQKYPQ